jgi:hypothetical protein
MLQKKGTGLETLPLRVTRHAYISSPPDVLQGTGRRHSKSFLVRQPPLFPLPAVPPTMTAVRALWSAMAGAWLPRLRRAAPDQWAAISA